jgi:protocatechuate 3,4-dioxygenase alpha subunit
MTDTSVPTPSQTVGPFFNIGLPGAHTRLVEESAGEAVKLWGVVYDGEGEAVPDALLEVWQANRAGRYDHPEDPREDAPLEDGFRGFGRAETDGDGRYEFVTVKPGPVPAPGGGRQAPHILVSVFARGVLKRLATRVYFPDETAANDADPVLSAVAPERRATLVAAEDGGGGLRFDVRLQGEGETVFFDV